MRLYAAAIIIISALSFSACAFRAHAQEYVPTPVEISSEKVNIGGNVYYVHKVLVRQTLYSISKAYGVPADDILKTNPALSEGLKAGMIIYIPDKEEVRDETAETVAGREKEKKKEPAAKKARRTKPEKNRYRKYPLRWFETLEEAAERHGVTLEAIIALNGIDTNSKKRVRSIYIPDAEYMENLKVSMAAGENGVTSGMREQETGIAESTDIPENGFRLYDTGEKHKISVVLPFNASLETDNMEQYMADFCSGLLAAAYSLKEDSLLENFCIDIIDLNRYPSAWGMISSGVLQGSELIIGPVSPKDMQPVAVYAERNRIPIVSPLDVSTEALAENNGLFYLFPPVSDTYGRQIDKIVSEDPDAGITVIYETGSEDSPELSSVRLSLLERGAAFNTFRYALLEGREIIDSMGAALDPYRLNKILIVSASDAFISDVMRNLNLLRSVRNYRIHLYGQSRWKNSDALDLELFHLLETRLSVPYHIDYSDSTVAEFVKNYKETFRTAPNSFSFQGYDILTFFVKAMNSYGRDFPEMISGRRYSLLQSDVRFVRSGNGSGYCNTALKDIVYRKDWTIESSSD